MNNITIRGARVVKLNSFTARGGQGLDVIIRDSVGSYTVYFQFTLYDDAALHGLQQLSVGDLIDVYGSVRVQIYKGRTSQDCFSVILENPRDIFNQSSCASVDSAGKTEHKAQTSEPDNDDDLPF